MLRRALGVLLIGSLSVSTAFACKRGGEEAVKVDDYEKPKAKKKLDTLPSKAEPKSHRATHVACSSADTPAPKTITYGPKLATPPGPACKSKADCKESPNGRCSMGHCTYDGCYDDKDCGNKVCECHEEGKQGYYCKAGDCAVDGDCGGNYCSPTWGMSCGAFTGVVGYYCHTNDDECVSDDECVKGEDHGYCAFDPDAKHWRCGYGHCVG